MKFLGKRRNEDGIQNKSISVKTQKGVYLLNIYIYFPAYKDF